MATFYKAPAVKKAPRKARALKAAAKPPTLPSGVASELGRLLRPQAAYRWLLPSLAAITPQYIEMTLRGALAGNHVQQWELFDLMEDTWPRLRKNAMELKNGVRNMELTVDPYHEDDEQPTPEALHRAAVVSAALRGMRPDPAADECAFDGTVFHLLNSWFQGVTVLETDWHVTNGSRSVGQIVAPRATYWVHPVCYVWSQEGRLGLRADANGRILGGIAGTTYQAQLASVMDFPPDKFLVGVSSSKSGTALSGALLRPLAWWWCAANFSADWLLNLAQVFGIPFRMANYDPNAPQATVDSICDMLQNLGSSGWAAFPAGTTIDFKEAGATAGTSPQESMLDRADKNCDLLVLGQTLTSDSGGGGKGGGSLALGKVHAGVKEDVISAAAKYVEDVFNHQLVPSILRLNFGDDSEAPSVNLVTEKEEDLEVKSRVIENLTAAGAGAVIGLDWISKTFGIPKPAPDEPTLSKPTPALPVPPAPPAPVTDKEDAADEIADETEDDDKAVAAKAALVRLREIHAIADDTEFQAALKAFARENS